MKKRQAKAKKSAKITKTAPVERAKAKTAAMPSAPEPAIAFDPSGPAQAGAGIYGLGCGAKDAQVHLIPVPFEATTSYRGGTSKGPQAIFEASMQVDLFDIDTGRHDQH